MLIQTGIPDKEAIEAVTPDETRFLKGRRCHRRVFSENPLQSLYKGLCKKSNPHRAGYQRDTQN